MGYFQFGLAESSQWDKLTAHGNAAGCKFALMPFPAKMCCHNTDAGFQVAKYELKRRFESTNIKYLSTASGGWNAPMVLQSAHTDNLHHTVSYMSVCVLLLSVCYKLCYAVLSHALQHFGQLWLSLNVLYK